MLRVHRILAVVAMFATATVVLASSASFVVTGKGIDLGTGEEVVEKDKAVTRFKAKVEVGKPFTLTAQGVVYPRGAAKGQPSAPESGAWDFDAKAFKKTPPAGKTDETEVVVTLASVSAGTSRVRFVGKILGYERAYEVTIEAAAAKGKE